MMEIVNNLHGNAEEIQAAIQKDMNDMIIGNFQYDFVKTLMDTIENCIKILKIAI